MRDISFAKPIVFSTNRAIVGAVILCLVAATNVLVEAAWKWRHEESLLDRRPIQGGRATRSSDDAFSFLMTWVAKLPQRPSTDSMLESAIIWSVDQSLAIQFEQGASRFGSSRLGMAEVSLSARGDYSSCKELVSRILRDYPSAAVADIEFKVGDATAAKPVEMHLKLRLYGAVRRSHGN